jgi:hypothetical protein
MKTITKQKYLDVQNDVKAMIDNRGGILFLDEIYNKNRPAWNKIQNGFQGWLMWKHDITAATARRHVDKASRELRHPHRTSTDNWGGKRR